ncbi:class I SAM-dependent DNA methyltransferase [Salinarimonas sp. NSM]|uniref:class I SAM-dependent DNA methyltransferase n=1 Tax=Salinarimonas sp. NSM TaxID=3458003 RepID=UPI004035B33D
MSRPSATPDIERFIARVKAAGGPERANLQIFVQDLCAVLGIEERPHLSMGENHLNDYVFERRVDFRHPDGSTSPGWIDLYKRDCFVLEAKQSKKRGRAEADAPDVDLLGPRRSGSAGPGRGWDKVMIEARRQAENYARALPVDHGYPPFVLVVDIGHVIEVFADFSGQGKNYAHFPDRTSYRIRMDDLRDDDVRARLKAIFEDPRSLDPARISAEVTRDVAERLARIAKRLEGKHDPKDVAEFLMRCLFTMFAEDVGLLPDEAFCTLVGELKDNEAAFVPALESLWRSMDQGLYEPRAMKTLRKFNGSLFKDCRALPLAREDIHELHVAAQRDWRDVEPAIFGTLLERALDPRERAKLGAHYTPRAYVERLVVPTIVEPLREQWNEVSARSKELVEAGRTDQALALVKAFHHELCTIRILDPACGTGNFLYVALELTKRLEGDVLEALDALGEDQARLALEGETVSPKQFWGLEINPRAVPIAELVLWIGYIKWQLRTGGPGSITDPVLHAYGTIVQQDALIAYDRQELLRGEDGKPLSRWDGVTMKRHPITGDEIPDPDARVELHSYVDPRRAPWPEADFVVGNPPFIGGKDMRAELGDGYAEACWKARPHIPGGADFVMHFWDEAATRLLAEPVKGKKGAKGAAGDSPRRLRRFGFITTNSIVQTFSRRVVERHLAAKTPLSLVFAVPDHPWLKASDKAAVRIAMTVCEKGEREGVLAEVVSEAGLNTDTPVVELETREGKVRGNLRLGVDLAELTPLLANEAIGVKGYELGTQGFILDPLALQSLLRREPGAKLHIHPYMNGRDLKDGRYTRYVIDLFPMNWEELGEFPVLQALLIDRVKNAINPNTDAHVLRNWWHFRRSGEVIRDATKDLPRFIATTRTAKHRCFSFLSVDIRAESKIVSVAHSIAEILSVLTSRIHVEFANEAGGWQGVGNDPVYQHTETFDPYPFPACITDPTHPLTLRLRDLGERLDAHRKARLAEHGDLTMTGLYNVLERVRALEAGADVPPLSEAERSVYERGLVAVLKAIHDDIDRTTLEAYGWEDLAPALVGKPGATTPSPHKSKEQEAAEEELIARLVALNKERAAEEKRGIVRWLRPDYQVPKLRHKLPEAAEQLDIGVAAAPVVAERPAWPTDGLEQIRVVRDVLSRAPAPAPLDAVVASFAGRATPARRARVEAVLSTLVEHGLARRAEGTGESAPTRWFTPR